MHLVGNIKGWCPAAFVAGLVCSVLLSSPIAQATYSGAHGKNGKIVFTAPGRNDKQDLFSIAKDGSQKKQLTKTKIDEFDPTFSPLGRVIAFQKGGSIFRMHPNGDNYRKLSRGSDPSFSPDGEILAFEKNDEIFRMRALDGGGVKRLTNSKGGSVAGFPSWGRSNKIAYMQCCPPALARGIGGTNLWQVNPDGTGQKLFAGKSVPGLWSDWSPNGLELTYTNRSADGSPALFIINRNGKNKRKILDDDVLGYYRGVWSPDGKWLVLNVEKLGDPPYLAIVKKDGTGFKKIPHTQGAMTPIWQPR